MGWIQTSVALAERARAAVAGSPAAPVVEAAALAVRRLARPSAGRNVAPDLPVWQQLQRVGGALTPNQVSAIIREADQGRMAGLMDLANEVRQKDCHLQAVLSTGEEAISGLPWELDLPPMHKRVERKAAEFCDRVLRSQRNFARFIAHHAGAAYYGYSVSEIAWARDGATLVPADLRPLAHRRFLYAYETGRLHLFDNNGTMTLPGIDLRADYPLQFVVSQPRINGDVPCREGLVRALMWAALFRNWSISDWLKLGEIAWKPWRTGTYTREATDEDINGLVAVLEGMTSSGVAVVPEGTKLEISWPGGGSSGAGGRGTHSELFAVVGAEMSKAVLGQTLTTEQGAVGSQALGRVHNEVRKDLREARAKSVAGDICRDLIEPLVRLNFGPGVCAPVFQFLTDDALDLSSFAASMKTLREAGLRIPAQWVRDQAGIPEPADDAELLGDADLVDTPPEPDPAPAPADEAPPPKEESHGDQEEKEAAREAAE